MITKCLLKVYMSIIPEIIYMTRPPLTLSGNSNYPSYSSLIFWVLSSTQEIPVPFGGKGGGGEGVGGGSWEKYGYFLKVCNNSANKQL